MEKYIESQLKKFKSLRTSSEVAEKSLYSILSSEQKLPFRLGFKSPAFSGVFAVVALFVVLATTQFNAAPSTEVAALQNESLAQEVESSEDFQIQLDEARYFSERADRVAAALDQVSR